MNKRLTFTSFLAVMATAILFYFMSVSFFEGAWSTTNTLQMTINYVGGVAFFAFATSILIVTRKVLSNKPNHPQQNDKDTCFKTTSFPWWNDRQ